MTNSATHSNDKRVVNGNGTINQLMPLKYNWAWDMFLDANKNHWTPLEIGLGKDIQQFKHTLSPAEVHVFTNVLSYLTTADIMAMRNIGLAVMDKMCAPELQIYQSRQVYEEALHTWTYQHCIESLSLDPFDVYNRYRTVPQIARKIEMAADRTRDAVDAKDLSNPADLKKFVMSLLFFSAVFEGVWFYHGFTPVFSLQRRNLMTGAGEQFQYILRDESMHVKFGLRLIRTLIDEEDVVLDAGELRAMWLDAEAAERDYIGYVLRDPILGYNAESHMEMFCFLANRRMKQVGLPIPYPDIEGKECPIKWLDEQTSISKEKNFFETKPNEYQVGGALDWS